MNKSILKPIVFGVLFGTAAFFVPFFLVNMIFFFMIIGLFFRLFWWGGGKHHMQHHFAYADKIRSMSEEDYAALKNKLASQRCGHYGSCSYENKTSKL